MTISRMIFIMMILREFCCICIRGKIAALAVFCSLALVLPALGASSTRDLVQRPDIGSGLWVILFMEGSTCEACGDVIPWAFHAHEAFPEFSFVLSYPESVLEELPNLPSDLILFTDRGQLFGRDLGIEYAPTVLVFISGRLFSKLEWPLTEGQLLRSIATASIAAPQLVSPSTLVGYETPAFLALNLDGSQVSSDDLPRPCLLAFLSPSCPSCWASLGSLAQTSNILPVVLVLVASPEEVSEEQRTEIEAYAGSAGQLIPLLVRDPEVIRSYGVSRSPSFFVIDDVGNICGVLEGYATTAELLQLGGCAPSAKPETKEDQ
jgi:hypothetical protein